MNSIEQKNGLYLEEERSPVFCLKATQYRVNCMYESFCFWLQVAGKEGVDVTESKKEFNDFYLRFQNKVSKQSKDSVGILLLEGCICLIHDRIGKYVREKIRRSPKLGVIEELGKELEIITQKYLFWKKIAKKEGVVCGESENIVLQSQIFALEISKETNRNPEEMREINKRRLIKIRRFITSHLIRSLYSQRISRLGQFYICKFEGTENKKIVSGIIKEAIQGLFWGSTITEIEARCQNIFELFKVNIQLLVTDPEKYHLMADIEVIRRQVRERMINLIKKAKKDPLKLSRIQELSEKIFIALDEGNNSKEFIKNVNRAINELEKTFSESTNFGCGFLNDK